MLTNEEKDWLDMCLDNVKHGYGLLCSERDGWVIRIRNKQFKVVRYPNNRTNLQSVTWYLKYLGYYQEK